MRFTQAFRAINRYLQKRHRQPPNQIRRQENEQTIKGRRLVL